MAKVCSCAFYFLQVLFTLLLLATPALAEESDELIRIKTVLHHFRDIEGRAPTVEDLFSEALKPGTAMSYPDIAVLSQIVRQLNTPEISKEALLDIIKSKRDSIRDFQCAYIGSDTHLNDEANSYSIECQYKMKDNMFFMDRSVTMLDGTVRSVLAYDGEHFYNYHPKPATDELASTVSIAAEKEPDTFRDFRLPTSNTMLMQSEQFGLSEHNYAYDLVRFLESPGSMLCESKEMVNGEECFVLCDWYTCVWLSPELNFSPVKVEAYIFIDHVADGTGSPIVDKRILNERREFQDYREFSNGVWLPYDVNTQYYNPETGARSVVSKTNASLIKVNSGLKKEDFTEFIPDGTIALDGPRNLVYEWGEGASIGGLVDDVVTRKRKGYLFAVNLAVVLLLVCIIGYRSYRRRKLGTE